MKAQATQSRGGGGGRGEGGEDYIPGHMFLLNESVRERARARTLTQLSEVVQTGNTVITG